jgi:ribose transport system substrate-binding protein
MQLRKGVMALAASGALAIALAGCNSGPTQASGAGAAGGGSSLAAAAKTGTTADLADITKLCGTKKLVVGMSDLFGGNSWRKITRAEFEDEAKKCPDITKTLYTDAQNNPQKQISDINGLVAQGVDVLIANDLGPSMLPTLRKATAAGVKVVPFIATPGGKVGTDYTNYVAEDVVAYGAALADWEVKALKGKGNVVVLGGLAGNSYSQAVYDAAKAALAKSGMKLLNADGYIVTNWDPGQTQKVVAGLLTKYSQIDGIISDYGGGSVGGIRAFLAANRPLPAWSANDSNEFACLWKKYNPTQPTFHIATVSSRNWMSRVALRQGVAAAEGISDPEPTSIQLPLFEDSVASGKMAPQCDPNLPPDAILSSQLSHAALTALFK